MLEHRARSLLSRSRNAEAVDKQVRVSSERLRSGLDGLEELKNYVSILRLRSI